MQGMKKTQPSIKYSLLWLTLAWVLTPLAAPPTAWADDQDPVIPLPPDVAKDLEVFGEGLVGKALPAPVVTDAHEYGNLGPGSWEYQILHGGKEGQKVRSEKYERLPDQNGAELWKRTIGSEFVEYMKIDDDHSFGKHLEDDLDLGYTSRFLPGVTWLSETKPGVIRTIESKIEAFKTDRPDHVSYRGDMTAKLSYVGRYEVTTPAGTWPAILVRSEFDIKIGPAKVTDTAYLFFAKGVGKIAEIETTKISALFIYNSSTQVVKVLTKYPKN